MLFQRGRFFSVPLILAVLMIVGLLLIYRFGNFREERAVKLFLEEVKSGDYQAAYQAWGPSSAYTFEDFMADWGEDGYYGRVKNYEILESKTRGSGVIVYVQIDNLKNPVAFWVERKTRTIGFSPVYEYQR